MNLDILAKTEIKWAEINPGEIRDVGCLFCNSSKKVVGKILVNDYDLYLLHCERDGVFWTSPQLGRTFFNSLYSWQYYEADKHNADILQIGAKEINESEKTRRIATAEKQITELKKEGILGKKILEIGSVKKDFIHEVARDNGCETSVLEISEYGVYEAIKKGIKVIPLPIEQTQNLPEKYFDLVTIYDFLEHTTNPRKVVRMIANSLILGGYFAVRVPNTKKTPRIHLADHLWHFSQNALENLLKQEGLVVFRSFESGIFPRNPIGENKIEHRTYFAKK